MLGGEIFVLKIFLICIIDFVKVMVFDLLIKIIGICFGEKLYEVMCLVDLCFEMYEYSDYFVIVLGIKFSSCSNDFIVNVFGEKGE